MLNDDNQTETNLSFWEYFIDDTVKINYLMWTMDCWMSKI